MSEAKLPKLFQDVLEAWDTVDATGDQAQPRLYLQLWGIFQFARTALAEDYPELDDWLFGYPYRHRAERRDELLRLIADAQKEASDDDAT